MPSNRTRLILKTAAATLLAAAVLGAAAGDPQRAAVAQAFAGLAPARRNG